jgi:hypothetical protein
MSSEQSPFVATSLVPGMDSVDMVWASRHKEHSNKIWYESGLIPVAQSLRHGFLAGEGSIGCILGKWYCRGDHPGLFYALERRSNHCERFLSPQTRSVSCINCTLLLAPS